MSDELRNRIEEALRREIDNGGSRTGDYAQAVIDDLGLTVTRTDGWTHKTTTHAELPTPGKENND